MGQLDAQEAVHRANQARAALGSANFAERSARRSARRHARVRGKRNRVGGIRFRIEAHDDNRIGRCAIFPIVKIGAEQRVCRFSLTRIGNESRFQRRIVEHEARVDTVHENERRHDARDDHDKHRKRSHERDLAPPARGDISLDIRASVHTRLIGKAIFARRGVRQHLMDFAAHCRSGIALIRALAMPY